MLRGYVYTIQSVDGGIGFGQLLSCRSFEGSGSVDRNLMKRVAGMILNDDYDDYSDLVTIIAFCWWALLPTL